MTIVLVTHLMDDVANYADKVYLLEKGKLIAQGSPLEFFQEIDFLEAKKVGVPKITKFAHRLQKRGLPLSRLPITIEPFIEEVKGG